MEGYGLTMMADIIIKYLIMIKLSVDIPDVIQIERIEPKCTLFRTILYKY